MCNPYDEHNGSSNERTYKARGVTRCLRTIFVYYVISLCIGSSIDWWEYNVIQFLIYYYYYFSSKRKIRIKDHIIDSVFFNLLIKKIYIDSNLLFITHTYIMYCTVNMQYNRFVCSWFFVNQYQFFAMHFYCHLKYMTLMHTENLFY